MHRRRLPAPERAARPWPGRHGTPPALRTDDMRARLAQQGSEPVGSSPEEFAAFIATRIPKWAELVRISGATVE